MSKDYRQHHYVPQWYQQRFMLPGQGKYHYLDLKPDVVVRDGHKFVRKNLLHWGAASCFAETDLYTTRWGSIENLDIEKYFFGDIDNAAPTAIDYWDNFEHPSVANREFNQLLAFMSTQKLRTPKGLGWVASKGRKRSKNEILLMVQQLQHLFCAIWTECVWQLADADASDVKFIVSDHPVTVYNRACFPYSEHCRGDNDPDIRLVATQTLFPLSLRRVLILTNLSWVRDPYQRETIMRPNPNMFRPALFNFMDIQTRRSLTTEEVVQINFIIKSRARRYIAAAEKEWLFPERSLKNPNWRKLGDGYLLMPEPRGLPMGGEVVIGYKDGSSEAFSEYGHRPWQRGYKDTHRERRESESLRRFQSEFARMQGPAWRGTSYEWGKNGPFVADEEFHQHYLRSDEDLSSRKANARRRDRRNS